MDISQVGNVKKQSEGETNYFPVPPGILKIITRSGLWICCYYDHVTSGPKSLDEFRDFPYYCVSHLLDGDGHYATPRHAAPEIMEPGDAVIVFPGKINNYGGRKKIFAEDSICFAGPTADALKDADILHEGIIRFGKERRLLPIIQKTREATLASMLEANIMLVQLLINLHRENQTARQTRPSLSLQKLLEEIHRRPEHWWTVGEMAEYCDISTNYLREMFRNETGMSPKQYIDQIKMGRAAEMLSASSMKITQISRLLGFKDPFHFIRRFSQITGISPKRYRERYNKTSR